MCFGDFHELQKVNKLSQSLFSKPLVPEYRPPCSYTGEHFGVEYLFKQSGQQFRPDVEKDVEQGMDGVLDDEDETYEPSEVDETLAPPSDEANTSEDEVNIIIGFFFFSI